MKQARLSISAKFFQKALLDRSNYGSLLNRIMYKLGLTYKRMDIYFNELREEFKEGTAKALGGLRKDLSAVNEGIQ